MSNDTPQEKADAVSAAAQSSNGKPKMLSREQIFAANDYKTEVVPVPEWGGALLVKSLTAEERDDYEQSLLEERRDGTQRVRMRNARAKLVVAAVIDDKGDPLFSIKDIEPLGKKSSKALQRVWEKARDLSGLTNEDIEELTADLEPAPSEQTTSAGR